MGVMTEPRVGAATRPDLEDDQRLIAAAGQGSLTARRTAFARLYERHKDAVWGFLLAHTGDRALAEDALQEAFLRAWRHMPGFQAGRAFRPWLLTIARNAATDLQRTRHKEQRTASRARAPGAAAPSALSAAEGSEARERARRALDALPPETRALLVQRHGLNTPLGELAEAFDVTERTVRNRLRAAAEELARALTKGARA